MVIINSEKVRGERENPKSKSRSVAFLFCLLRFLFHSAVFYFLNCYWG